MIGAILKLSYNQIGENTIIGGICGTCFAIDRHRLLTAEHIISKNSFTPDNGFEKVRYWALLESGQNIEIYKNNIESKREKDLSIIKTSKWINGKVLKVINSETNINSTCGNYGYTARTMPDIDGAWSKRKFNIKFHSLQENRIHSSGYVKSIKNAEVNTNDLNLKSRILELSYGGREGMSGGCLQNENNEIIGLMSFGLPPDQAVKNILFAVDIREIINYL